jgi:cyanophycinase-like exopeptidase
MPEAGPLHWLDGAGWLVLSGGGAWQKGETLSIDQRIVALMDLFLPFVVLATSDVDPEDVEALLDYYSELGGPPGEVLTLSRRKDANRSDYNQLLNRAGLIYLSDGATEVEWLEILQDTPMLPGIEEAYLRGTSIIGMGTGAIPMGAWISKGEVEGSTTPQPGWNWIKNVIVQPYFEPGEPSVRLRELMRVRPESFGLGLPRATALAFGPDGQVETWGTGDATIMLPLMYTS